MFTQAQKNDTANIVLEYLTLFPGQYPNPSNARIIVDPLTQEGRDFVKEKVIRELSKTIAPNTPTTVPDKLTADILRYVFKHDREDRAKIQTQYINQKQTEMMIGQLLEYYIAKKGYTYGWRFATTAVKSVDFIKKDGLSWTTLQIKNSDNTENSSSSTVRGGTTIKKWARRNSKKGTYFWDSFPDATLRGVLSERGFQKFIVEYFKP